MGAPRSSTAPRLVSFIRVIAPFAAGFFVSNYYRSVNAVLSPRLVADLDLTAADLGLLTSIYFFTAAIMQAPIGMLMDRYGPKRVQVSLMLAGFAGVLMFALGQSHLVVILGRAMMGVGAAGALMAAFQAIIEWFPAERRPFLNGCALSIGGLGTLSATWPTEFALRFTDWRGLMVGVACFTLAIAVLMFAVAPEKEIRSGRLGLRDQLSGVVRVYKDPLFWRLAPLYAASVGANLALLGLWAGPWLKDVAALTPDEVASNLLVVAMLQTMNYIAVGYLATILTRHGVTLRQIVGVGAGLFAVSQLALVLPTGDARWTVLIGMGCLANINILLYPVLAERFPPTLMGRANTALNLFVFVGAFVLQYAVGLLIDLFPPVAPGTYPPVAYQTAFGVMIAVQAVVWVWYCVPERGTEKK